jgi:serine/threonine protein kinase
MNIPDLPAEGMPLPGAPRYVLRKLLGRGGFGDAYLADDEELTRRVVIKLLMNLEDPSIRDRFKREARISANIRHPAVVQVFDIGALPDGRPYFIMEWIDGTSLTQFINDRGATLSLSRALTLIAEAAEGLEVAHQMGVIHRDIKPDNILVTRDGHAKLIDFGIAKKALQEAEQRATIKQTSAGMVLGTPRYISPEQAMAKVLAGTSDLYSLGCVMYTLLTGTSPFDGTPQQLMMQHVDTPAPSLAANGRGRNFPPAVEGIVARLLAKDPARRFQTGAELAKALRQAADRARSEEETDATSALPAVTSSAEQLESRTVSHAHSAPQGAYAFADTMGPSRPSVPFGAPASTFGTSEGAATAALDSVAAATPPVIKKDESLSSRMPVTVMRDDLTGRTVSTRSKAPVFLAIAGAVVLIGAAGVGAKVLLFKDSPTTTSTASKATDDDTPAKSPTIETTETTEKKPESKPTVAGSPQTPPTMAGMPTATTTTSSAPTAAPTPAATTLANKPTITKPTTTTTTTAKPPTTAAPTVATVAKPSATTAPTPTATAAPTGGLGAIDDRK